MPLTTSLNISPYFDDFDESKKYYRILFKPATAVQARELTQLQSILQNQIERFGDAIYQSGTVIKGCPITYIPALDFVRIQDQNLDGDIVEIRDYSNTVLVSNTSNLHAYVVQVAAGSEATYPDTNRLYIRYMNSGTSGQKVFGNNEVLRVYTKPVSSNTWANNTANTPGGLRIKTLANTTAGTTTVSKAYGIHVGDGIIYQKGFFVLVDPVVSIINDVPSAVGNTLVGFQTAENIYTADQDSSLNDNALGYENESAPGADRLRLDASLIAVDPDDLANTADFTPIVSFNFGYPVSKDLDPQYSRLGDELARRNNETNGNYVIKPFTVATKAHPNTTATNYLRGAISAGSGYVMGHRVELIRTAEFDVRKGTDTETAEAQLATMNYGSYVYVKEMTGSFMFTGLQDVDLYGTAQQALTNHRFITSGVLGSKIGVATVRSVVNFSGTPGLPDAQYKVFLFNIRMNTGQSFASVRSLYYNGTNKAFADIVLDSGSAKLKEPEKRTMLWNFGKNAIKSLSDGTNPSDAEYVFRQQTEGTLSTDGTITLTLPAVHSGGSNKLNYGLGVVGDGNEDDFIVTLLANTYIDASASYSVNVSSTNTDVWANNSGAAFNTTWNAGDYIKANNEIRRVVSVTNATHVVVDENFLSTASGKSYQKFYPAGHVFSLYAPTNGIRTVNVTSTTTAVINTGAAVFGTLAATANVMITYNTLRYSTTTPAQKIINKGTMIKIDCATHSAGLTGPWCLGLADVHKLRNIYVGSSYSTSNPDLLSYFYFDHGQKDTHYDMARLYLKPGKVLAAASKLFIKLDHFTPSYASGIGFFSVQSYPIDDANTANTNAITTEEIPMYYSETGMIYSLRDCVDFRSYLNNTANLVSNTSGSCTHITVNPANATQNDYAINVNGTYVPTPDLNFETTLTYYLGRKDILYFTTEGSIRLKEGVPSEKPNEPDYPLDGMPVATINLPPYPTLSNEEQALMNAANKQSKSVIRATNSLVQTQLITNRRYTMRDIGQLESRISNLEYYMSLSLLEKAATDMQIMDTNGLNRFKNGIFVDPFTSHALGDVSNPEYKIAIDKRISVARPFYETESVEMMVANTANTQQTGRLITLPYTSILFIQQPKASKARNTAPVAYNWAGNAFLFPNYDQNVDRTSDPVINVNIDLAQPWQDMANSPFGMNYGDWDVVSSTTTDPTTNWRTAGSITPNPSNGITTFFGVGETTSTTTSNLSRTNQKLSIDVNQTSYNLGSFVEDITFQPYMRSREIAFYASNLRPSTRVYPFFDDVNVSAYCAPGVANDTITDTSDHNIIERSGNWGDALTTTASGEVAGKFLIPANTFRTGEKTFKLADITDYETDSDSVTTMASADYTSSAYAVRTQGVTLTTTNPQFAVTETTEVKSTTTTNTRTNFTSRTSESANPDMGIAAINPFEATYNSVLFDQPSRFATSGCVTDPVAQGFRVNAPAYASGVYLTSIGVYFKKKSTDDMHGITCYICEMLNGYPNTSRVIPYSSKHLTPAQVSVSDNATSETVFTFEAPVYLSNSREYAFVLKPDGGDPDYLVWAAELGGKDVTTGTAIFSQPYSSTMFISASESTWTALQTEYIKFRINRANFTKRTGFINFKNINQEFFTLDTITFDDADDKFRVGDVVYKQINSTTGNVNTSVKGIVQSVDLVNNKVQVTASTGNFVAGNVLQFHRLANTSVTANTSNTQTYIASANIVSVDNIGVNAYVPRFGSISPTGTSIVYKLRGTKEDYTKETSYFTVKPETETELYDVPRIVASKTNEVSSMSSNSSLDVQLTLGSDNPYVSPVIDVVRAAVLCVHNLIDPLTLNTTTEYGNFGSAQTKYISKPVTLAAGQDAEDIKVYLTSYRPPSSDVLVYVRVISSDDPANLSDKTWTLMKCDNPTVYSNYRDTSHYIEYTYSMPLVEPNTATPVLDARGYTIPNTAAWSATNSIVYEDSDGATYDRVKSYQIKIVLLSSSTARVPRIADVRALALQY